MRNKSPQQGRGRGNPPAATTLPVVISFGAMHARVPQAASAPAAVLESSTPSARRLFAEMFGTFLLVLAASGGRVVEAATGVTVGRVAEVAAPGLAVMGVILSTGAVSGAHLNPSVTVAFALRRDFPWRRVPGYILAQLVGAALACGFLAALFGRVGMLGATEPAANVGDLQAMLIEVAVTVGLVTTILGTASAAQNVGPLSALAVGGYIVLAGLWAGPVSGASMNPARSFGPDLVLVNFAHYWVYVVGPLVGAAIAVGFARILRGPGGDAPAQRSAQGKVGDSAPLTVNHQSLQRPE